MGHSFSSCLPLSKLHFFPYQESKRLFGQRVVAGRDSRVMKKKSIFSIGCRLAVHCSKTKNR